MKYEEKQSQTVGTRTTLINTVRAVPSKTSQDKGSFKVI